MPNQISPEELKEIVRRGQSGSSEDFQRLYDLFVKQIFNFVWRLTGSAEDAEDLAQDTFLKVHTELKRLRDPGQFRFWLYRIARNEVYQKLRQTRKAVEVSIDDEDVNYYSFLADESGDWNPEQQLLAGELDEILGRALKAMSPKYREVFVLAVLQKMSYQDITEIVGRSLLSVKTDIYRARLIIKNSVNAYLKRKP